MDEAFDGKIVFLTGATGMLGTASLVKITLDTTVARLYVLVRGGSGKCDRLLLYESPTDCRQRGSGQECINYCHYAL
jgi:hypothetical protein